MSVKYKLEYASVTVTHPESNRQDIIANILFLLQKHFFGVYGGLLSGTGCESEKTRIISPNSSITRETSDAAMHLLSIFRLGILNEPFQPIISPLIIVCDLTFM